MRVRIISRHVRQPFLIGSIKIHDIDLWIIVALRGENNFLSIWRPDWPTIKSRAMGELGDIRSIEVGRKYFPITSAVGLKSDLFSIWRRHRITIDHVCESFDFFNNGLGPGGEG